MSRMPLGKLKKLASPALRHAELVSLARDVNLTPNQVMDQAKNLGWPRRPAKAARSLAILRRDCGVEALEAFITRNEHARSERSETEHAREKEKMTERVKRSLERLSDPRKKLEIMIRHEMNEEATAYLHELVGSMVVYFDWNGDRPNPGELLSAPADPDSPVKGLKLGFHAADTDLSRDRLNIYQDSVINLDFLGVIQTLGWSEIQVYQFVRRVIKVMVERPIYTHIFVWVVEGMQRAARYFLSPDDELAIRAERWMLLYRFRGRELFRLRETALPEPIRRQGNGPRTPQEIREELNPIVDRMLELGMTEAEVRAEFFIWLDVKTVQSYSPEFILAVAGAKCFPWDDKILANRLRLNYLEDAWKHVVEYGGMEIFRALGRVGLYSKKDAEFFFDELATLLSKGKAGRVFDILIFLGRSLGVYPRGLGSPTDGLKAPKEMMNLLAPTAFALAKNAEQYGVATALAQHFDCVDEEVLLCELNKNLESLVCELVGDHVQGDYALLKHLLGHGIDEEDREDNEDLQHKLIELGRKRDLILEARRSDAQRDIDEVHDLARDLSQPICLDWMDRVEPVKGGRF